MSGSFEPVGEREANRNEHLNGLTTLYRFRTAATCDTDYYTGAKIYKSMISLIFYCFCR